MVQLSPYIDLMKDIICKVILPEMIKRYLFEVRVASVSPNMTAHHFISSALWGLVGTETGLYITETLFCDISIRSKILSDTAILFDVCGVSLQIHNVQPLICLNSMR